MISTAAAIPNSPAATSSDVAEVRDQVGRELAVQGIDLDVKHDLRAAELQRAAPGGTNDRGVTSVTCPWQPITVIILSATPPDRRGR